MNQACLIYTHYPPLSIPLPKNFFIPNFLAVLKVFNRLSTNIPERLDKVLESDTNDFKYRFQDRLND